MLPGVCELDGLGGGAFSGVGTSAEGAGVPTVSDWGGATGLGGGGAAGLGAGGAGLGFSGLIPPSQ